MRLKLHYEDGFLSTTAIVNDQRQVQIENWKELNEQIKTEIERKVREATISATTETNCSEAVREIFQVLAERNLIPIATA